MYHHLDTTKKQFIGKNLDNITREDNSTVLIHFADGSKCRLSVDGDCCSHSIFYAFEVPEEIKGGIVEDIIEDSYEEYPAVSKDPEEVAFEKAKQLESDFGEEENRVWNVIFKTNLGCAVIRHINASNGYYDGDTSYALIP